MKIPKLKKIRQDKSITQKALAKQLKIALRTYKYYESGERIPDVHTAIRIAKALSITTLEELEDLFETPQRQLRETNPPQKQENSNTE